MPTLVQGGTVTVGISPRWYCNSLYQSKVVLSLLVQVQGGTVTVGISPRWYCHCWYQSKVVLSLMASVQGGTVTVGLDQMWYCHCWYQSKVVLSLLVLARCGTVTVGISPRWYCHCWSQPDVILSLIGISPMCQHKEVFYCQSSTVSMVILLIQFNTNSFKQIYLRIESIFDGFLVKTISNENHQISILSLYLHS
jgi:hypothetical protein